MKKLLKLLGIVLLISCTLLFAGCEILEQLKESSSETTDETPNKTPEEKPEEQPEDPVGPEDPYEPETPKNDGVVEDGVVTVYTADALLALIDSINSGEVDNTITIQLGADINLFELDFTPIYEFRGTIDGKGYSISNISLPIDGAIVESTDGNWVGYDIIYIGFISSAYDATIRDLTLDGVRFDEETEEQIFVGALVGYTEGIVITNCTVSSEIYAGVFHPEVGYRDISGMSGLIGYSLDAHVENTTIDCLIDYTANSYEAFAGSVLGVGNVRVRSCEIKLDIRFSGEMYGHTGYIIGMERTLEDVTRASMYDSKVNGTLNVNNPWGYAWGAVGQGYLYNPETGDFQDLEADNVEINITTINE